MTRRTNKYLCALDTVFKMDGGGRGLLKRNMENDEVYQILEKQGYNWNGKEWRKFEKPKNAVSTGTVDIRHRAHNGDVMRACKFIGEALERAGFTFTRLSHPDPDDRDGPAMTARVYMSGVLPKQDQ